MKPYLAPFYWRVGDLIYGPTVRAGNIRLACKFDPEAYHYLCPECGEVWASIFPARVKEKCYHRALAIHCPEHGLGHLHLTDAELRAAPLGILQREVELATSHPEVYSCIFAR